MKIRLGKLPTSKTVRVTISLPEPLKAQMERYAQLYSQTWGQEVDGATLIPAILEKFLAGDLAFRIYEKELKSSGGTIGASTND